MKRWVGHYSTLTRGSYYHCCCDHIVIVSILITGISNTPAVTGGLWEAVGINERTAIMYEPQYDVYISSGDKQTKSVILRHRFIQGTASSEEKQHAK